MWPIAYKTTEEKKKHLVFLPSKKWVSAKHTYVVHACSSLAQLQFSAPYITATAAEHTAWRSRRPVLGGTYVRRSRKILILASIHLCFQFLSNYNELLLLLLYVVKLFTELSVCAFCDFIWSGDVVTKDEETLTKTKIAANNTLSR